MIGLIGMAGLAFVLIISFRFAIDLIFWGFLKSEDKNINYALIKDTLKKG